MLANHNKKPPFTLCILMWPNNMKIFIRWDGGITKNTISDWLQWHKYCIVCACSLPHNVTPLLSVPCIFTIHYKWMKMKKSFTQHCIIWLEITDDKQTTALLYFLTIKQDCKTSNLPPYCSLSSLCGENLQRARNRHTFTHWWIQGHHEERGEGGHFLNLLISVPLIYFGLDVLLYLLHSYMLWFCTAATSGTSRCLENKFDLSGTFW